jgi:hypothetical protein
MPISSHCCSRPKSGLIVNSPPPRSWPNWPGIRTVQNEHSGLTTLADARLRHRDQPTFQFYDQPQDCKGAARKFLCSTNPFVRRLPARAAMKRCAQCQGKLGLGVRSRNLWNGRWWVHVRFCSTHCEALHELERRQRQTSLVHTFLSRSSPQG